MNKITILCLMFFTVLSWSQKSPLDQKIQEIKNKGFQFENIEGVIKESKQAVSVSAKGLKKANQVSTFLYDSKQFPKNNNIISLTFPSYDLGNIEVELLENEGISEKIVFQNRNTINKSSDAMAKHYRGTVKGYEKSLVALSLFEDEIMGVISIKGVGDFNISKLKGADYHSVLKTTNLEDNSFDCEMTELEDTNDQEVNKSYKTTEDTTASCVSVYFEVSYEIYSYFDSDTTDTENYVTALFNQVSALYLQDLNVNLNISEILIHTSEDPYFTSTATGDDNGEFLNPVNGELVSRNSANLGTFATTRTTYNGALAHLLTLTAGGSGGIAYPTGCMYSNKYGLSNISPIYEEYPNYSRQVKVVAHELGHNFGSYHTHDCVWNGDNSQIDDYGNFLYNGTVTNDGNTNSCVDVDGYTSGTYTPLLDVAPTIMSYYDSNTHQYQLDESGTFNLTDTTTGVTTGPYSYDEFNYGDMMSNGFGEQPGAIISNNIAACYASDCEVNEDCPLINEVIEDVLEDATDVQKASSQLLATNIINSNGEASYQAGEYVLLSPGFHAKSGSNFHAIIEDCESTVGVSSSSSDISKESLEEVLDEEDSLVEIDSNILIYPNPTSGNLSVYLPEVGLGSIQIISASGQVVFEREINEEQLINFSIERLPVGIYILNLKTESTTIHKKFIKN